MGYEDVYSPLLVLPFRHVMEENTLELQCRGKVFYMTKKDVWPWQELLVYYGNGYAGHIGIDPHQFEDMDSWHTDKTAYRYVW